MPETPFTVLAGTTEDKERQCVECYERWFRRLYAYLRRFNIGAEAEDLAQRTLIWACQSPAERCIPGKLFNYARSRAIESLRQLQRAVAFDPLVHDGTDDGYSQYGDLYRCLEKLSPREREIVYLMMDGVTFQEIADVMKIRGAKPIFYRALDKLHECITGRERGRRPYKHRQNSENEKEEEGRP